MALVGIGGGLSVVVSGCAGLTRLRCCAEDVGRVDLLGGRVDHEWTNLDAASDVGYS